MNTGDRPASPPSPPAGGVARTALWTAAARARESERADRLFSDAFAAALAAEDGADLLREFTPADEVLRENPYMPLRTRWYDDLLADLDVPQVVLLGAGLDTRAFRLGWPAGVVLFEVDDASVLQYKEARLDAIAAGPRCERRSVPTDLRGPWADDLLAAGYRPESPAAWLAEGVLFYLAESLAHSVVRRAWELAAPRSWLAADLLAADVLRSPQGSASLRRLAEMGSAWQFGTDDVSQFISSCGWHVESVTTPDQLAQRYGRRSIPAGRSSRPHSYLVIASKPKETVS
jgi:methyltransferase (TIGR00027 family)